MTARLRKFIIGATALAAVGVAAPVTVSANADDVDAKQGPDHYIRTSGGSGSLDGGSLAAADSAADGWGIKVRLEQWNQPEQKWTTYATVADSSSGGGSVSKKVNPPGAKYRLHIWKYKSNGSTSGGVKGDIFTL